MQRRMYSLFAQPLITVVLVAFLISLVSCGSSSSLSAQSGSTTSPTAATVTQAAADATVGPEERGTTVPQDPQAPTATGYAVKVYFSKFPDSLSNYQAVFPVDRISPTVMVGTYAIQLLIAGPTPKEWDAGYFSELNSILTGPSNCSSPHPTGGPDFQLALNMKGSHSEQGTATVRFCRTTASPGVGADARIISEITATLKQFPSIKKVVILTKDGHCFGDLSGKDTCLA